MKSVLFWIKLKPNGMMTDWAITLPFSEMGLTEPVLRSIGWMLLHSVWQGALVAVLLAGGLHLLRERSARLRYAAGVAALASLLVLPAVTWTLLPTPAPPSAVVSPAEADVARAASNEPALVWRAESIETSDASLWSTWRSALHPYVAWLAVAWGAGVLLLGLRLMGGWIYTRRLRHTGTPVPGRWQARANVLADRLGLTRVVRVFRSDRIESPMVVGWWKPVILLPLGVLSGLPPQQVEALITHELAHIRRHDILVGWLQAVTETLLFYHPAVWWISRQVRIEREHCCDDLVVMTGTDRLAYARALTELADASSNPSVAFAPAAGEGPLLGRIRRLMGASPSGDGWKHRMPLAVVAALIVAVPIGLAACASQQATTAEPDRPEEPVRAEEPAHPSVEPPPSPEQSPRAEHVRPTRPDSNQKRKKREVKVAWFAEDREVTPDSIRAFSFLKDDSTHAVTIITDGDTIRIQGHPGFDEEWHRSPEAFERSQDLRLWVDSLENGFAYRLKGDSLRDVIIRRLDSLKIPPMPPPAIFFKNMPDPPDAPEFDFHLFRPDSLPEMSHPPRIDLDSLLKGGQLDPERQREWKRWSERWRERAEEWGAYAEQMRQHTDSLRQNEVWKELRRENVWEEYADRMQRRVDSLRQNEEWYTFSIPMKQRVDSLRRELMERHPEHLREQAERLRRQAERLEEQARELERGTERDSTEGNE